MVRILRSLSDQITLRHGPRDLLGRYFSLADERMREIGVRLRLRSDFDALKEINIEHRDSWPEMLPICDPEHSNLKIDSAFWLEGVDERGDTVLTHAVRLFDFTGTNVVEEIRSLRVYYEDPEPHLSAGEKVELDAPKAAVVTGRTMYGGAIWVRPDWRRFGLTRIIVRICSAYAHTRWNTAFTWGFMAPQLQSVGLAQAYGPYHTTDRITASLAHSAGPKPRLLLWMDTPMMLADLAAVVAEAAEERARQRNPHDHDFIASIAPGY
jgi:hypothetical protein